MMPLAQKFSAVVMIIKLAVLHNFYHMTQNEGKLYPICIKLWIIILIFGVNQQKLGNLIKKYDYIRTRFLSAFPDRCCVLMIFMLICCYLIEAVINQFIWCEIILDNVVFSANELARIQYNINDTYNQFNIQRPVSIIDYRNNFTWKLLILTLYKKCGRSGPKYKTVH